MENNVSRDQPAEEAPPLLVVIGAGPKAAAIAAKARALKNLKKGEVRVLIIEAAKIGANWTGLGGHTTGQGELGTPPEKDVGFPYNSDYGSKVDKALVQYSWQSYLVQLSETSYSDWLDRGQLRPKHLDWGLYLKWVLESVKAESEEEDQSAPQIEIMELTEVREIEPTGGKLRLTTHYKNQVRHIEADGVVLTGPGEAIMPQNIISLGRKMIFDARYYWKNIDKFDGMVSGKVAVLGGGERAASVARSLLDLTLVPKGPSLEIDIINRYGAIFTRGESYNENKYYSNPSEWTQLDETVREDYIQRAEREVFSAVTPRRLDRAENVHTVAGEVSAVEELAIDKVLLHLTSGNPPMVWEKVYDKVVVALGFDPLSPLKLFPRKFLPAFNKPAQRELFYKQLSRGVDRELRVPFDFVPALAGTKLNVHMPMISAFSQGPGFPNLSCLGHVSDRILSAYIPSARRS
jgi:mycobactin lysine-N-oxygenase